nr:methylated-DNA--[protein]-cysteine S-methyltransferase [Chromobacterium sp. ASV5]
MEYNAIVAAPFGPLGVACEAGAVTRFEFLPQGTAPRPAAPGSLAWEAARQVQAYCADPAFVFDLPYRLQGTPHQLRVWEQIAAIPLGEVLRYQDIAVRLASSARAVGGACGRNPLPLIIPCHRVVASGGLGGFNQSTGDETLNIKRWLLRHERG